MWIFLSRAFVSIVADRGRSTHLLCRARRRGDLRRAFGEHCRRVGVTMPRERVTPLADYRYRVSLPRTVVLGAIAEHVRAINYENFKASLPDHDSDRHDAYMRVWHAMHDFQRNELSPLGSSGYAEETEPASAAHDQRPSRATRSRGGSAVHRFGSTVTP